VQEPLTPPPAPKFEPWTPPGAELATVDPGAPAATASGPVYDAGQVALGTFFGTCVAGAVLMAINDHRFGRGKGAGRIVVGVVATALTIGVALLLPKSIPGAPLAIATAFGMRAYAKSSQPYVQEHIAKGGKRGSGWVAFGIGLGCMVLVAIPIFIIAFVTAMADGPS
jgi:hypothetical protein